jgi:hypothetical protein
MNQKRLKYMDAFKHESILGSKPNEVGEINKHGITEATDIDSYLRCSTISCRDKENDITNKENCDDIIISNLPRQRNLNHGCYWITPNKSFGRGFGQLDINNDLRYPDDTRNIYESNPLAIRPDRFYKLFRNVQDPGHLVMEIPRGGYATRHMNKC